MSRSADSPRSRQGRATRIRDLLRSQIVSEQPLFRLPSEEELAREYHVSRNTMREALALLVDEGVLRRSKGIGTTLIVERHAREYDGEAGFAAALPELTSRIENVNVDLEIVPTTPYLRARFGPEEEFFLFWERVTVVAGSPQTVWRSHLPARRFAILVDNPPEAGESIYDVIHEISGAAVARTRRTVEARACDAMTARLLGVPPGTPALHIERSMFAADGRLMELGYAWVRGDRYAVSYDTEHLEHPASSDDGRPRDAETAGGPGDAVAGAPILPFPPSTSEGPTQQRSSR
ncbi:GntR family transcriptional regulator [Microbacterium tumbae]